MSSAPIIIQGGMGIGVSNWTLARAVSMMGQLGVVSGTSIDTVLVRRLQDGDPEGVLRRAMSKFPISGVVDYVVGHYFKSGGRKNGEPYRLLPMYQRVSKAMREQITMLASFVEVSLAKEGHPHPVGLNLLTKIQLPNLATIYGAMMAGVDYILMGAGIPREVPAALENFMQHRPAALKLDVEGERGGEAEMIVLDPNEHFAVSPLHTKPKFMPIVSSHTLAQMLARKGGVDGFVVEGPKAGGHNAPPRDRGGVRPSGELVYNERDEADLGKMRELGLPFWIAGGVSTPGHLQDALARGASGVQIGTLFSLAKESGIAATIKAKVLQLARRGLLRVKTDSQASPTGFPFKVVDLPESLARDEVYQRRSRICDLGYLRTAFRKQDGAIGFRCPGEPVDDFVKKGGDLKTTEGKKCLCNSLLATVGLGQRREEQQFEAPLLTSGDQIQELLHFPPAQGDQYSVQQVVDYLLSSGCATVQ